MNQSENINEFGFIIIKSLPHLVSFVGGEIEKVIAEYLDKNREDLIKYPNLILDRVYGLLDAYRIMILKGDFYESK